MSKYLSYLLPFYLRLENERRLGNRVPDDDGDYFDYDDIDDIDDMRPY